MVEEMINFGMNTSHILQINDLNERIDENIYELSKSLQDIFELQNSIEKKQSDNIAIQEKEFQKQEYIQELRNSVFNLKVSMEDIYQSSTMDEIAKFLQFRNICSSSAMKAFEVNYYETFADKEYVSSVKKYLFYTRDELFNSFSNNIQKTLKEIEDKETQLIFENVDKIDKPIGKPTRKPITPSAVPMSVDELKQLNEKRPIQPHNYHKLSANEYAIGETNGKFSIFINSLFTKITASVVLFILLIIVFLNIQMGGTILFLIIPIVIIWILFVPYSYFVEHIELPKIKQMYEYELKLKKYLEQQKKINENYRIIRNKDSDIGHYKYQLELKIYQEQLKKYQEQKSKIKNLKNEITTLYKMLKTI